MDKLRAIQYFVASAQTGSFSAASRLFDVSIPAVAKLVNALEKELGIPLFARRARGLELTGEGARYLQTCEDMLATLAEAEASILPGNSKLKGQLTIGTPPQIAKYCLWPALAEFHQRHPDLHIDIQPVSTVSEPVHSPVDVYVLMGWMEYPEFVSRQIGSIRMLICASPGYWATHGKPVHPRELAAHNCLLFRNPVGTVLDLWEFKQGARTETVTVNGWLSSSYRDILLEGILRGDGVARMSDTMLGDHLRSGRLVRVLEDWSIDNNPPIQVMYKPEQRRSPKVRAFVDFVTQVFAQLDADAGHGPVTARGLRDKPYWYDRIRRKASTARKG